MLAENPRVCRLFMILFLVDYCVLLLLFGVLYVMVVILVLVVTFYVFGACLFGDCREEGEEKWRCDLV